MKHSALCSSLVSWLVSQSQNSSNFLSVGRTAVTTRNFPSLSTHNQTNKQRLAAILPHSNAHFVTLQADALTDTWPSMFNKTLPYTKVTRAYVVADCTTIIKTNTQIFISSYAKMSSFSLGTTKHTHTHTHTHTHLMLCHGATWLDLLTRKQNGLCCAGKWHCGSLDRRKMEAMRSFERPTPSHSPHTAASRARRPLSLQEDLCPHTAIKNASNVTDIQQPNCCQFCARSMKLWKTNQLYFSPDLNSVCSTFCLQRFFTTCQAAVLARQTMYVYRNNEARFETTVAAEKQ
jgi:hypothetical protein